MRAILCRNLKKAASDALKTIFQLISSLKGKDQGFLLVQTHPVSELKLCRRRPVLVYLV
jgi:hypothetical protein